VILRGKLMGGVDSILGRLAISDWSMKVGRGLHVARVTP
jgi:hypothetical protein